MPKFIVLSPEGSTIAPNENMVENFQVIAFVVADTAAEVIHKIQTDKEYKFILDCKFDETWVHELVSEEPQLITNLINEDHPVVKQLISILSEDYSDVEFDISSDDTYYFDAYADAEIYVKVEVADGAVKIHDKYLDDKHYTHVKDVSLNERVTAIEE